VTARAITTAVPAPAANADQTAKMAQLLDRQADLMQLLETSTLLNALNALRLNQYVNKLTNANLPPVGKGLTPGLAVPRRVPFTSAARKPSAKLSSKAAVNSHELQDDVNRFMDSMRKVEQLLK